MGDEQLVDRATAWRDIDPDPETRAELDALLAGDHDELAARFEGRLTFGTAGLRGPLGAGPTRMNRVLVRTTAAAIAEVLHARGEVSGPVAVGFDARYNSDVFAEDTARVLAAAGIDVALLPTPLPTPVLAYAVRSLDACAGVMVTASHNPPADNGYKVYWGDGAQIVPPVDVEISDAIDRIGLVGDDRLAPADDPHITVLPSSFADRYVASIPRLAPDAPGDLRVVYSAMHGVGGATMLDAFAAAGFPTPVVVDEQFAPDPDFPTVSFPNPEEPGAMDLLLGLAEREQADLAIANDPDADRLAAAVPSRTGGWRVLSGNELGWLLAEHALVHSDGDDRFVSTSVVSSDLLGRLAEAHGVRSARTLTGFKWIVRPAIEDPSLRFVFGYEEALGYLVGDAVLDKDGISAAVALTERVAELRDEGRSIEDALDDLELRFGVHATDGWSVRFEGPDGSRRMAELMDGYRSGPPVELAGHPVDAVRDLAAEDPPTDAVMFTADTVRLTIRPSGTEPKMKLYCEVVEPVADGDLAGARARAAGVLTALREQMAAS
ncbi:MAG: phospho-sugar mutase [Actinomycetota bacterium]